MAEEIARLSAAFAERMRELRADPTRSAAGAAAQPAAGADARARRGGDGRARRPSRRRNTPSIFRPSWPISCAATLQTCPAHAFAQAPALSESDAGTPASWSWRRPTGCAWWLRPIAPGARTRWGGSKGGGLRRVVSDLLRAKLPLADADAVALAEAAARDGFTYASYSPNQAVLGALERHVAARGLSAELRRALERLLAEMTTQGADDNVQGRKLRSGVEALLAHQEHAAPATPSRCSSRRAMPGAPPSWRSSRHCRPMCRGRSARCWRWRAQGGKNAKPAKGWLKSAAQALERPDRAQLGEHLLDLIECHEPGTNIALENQETMRALLWLAAMAAPEAAARRLEAFAQKCLTFSAAHFAYLSLVLGNASIHAFALMPGTAGVGEPHAPAPPAQAPGRDQDRRQGAGRARAGARHERGRARGDRPAGLRLCIRRPPRDRGRPGHRRARRSPTRTRWRRPGAPPTERRSRARPPRSRRAMPMRSRSSRRAPRRSARRSRRNARGSSGSISTSASGRSTQWRARYLDEPLVARMARRLIWSFKLGERWVAGLPEADGVFDEGGTPLDLDGADVRVRLWHPMQSDGEPRAGVAAAARAPRRHAAVQAGAPRDLRPDRRRAGDAHPLEPLCRAHRAAAPVPRALPGARLERAGLRQLVIPATAGR